MVLLRIWERSMEKLEKNEIRKWVKEQRGSLSVSLEAQWDDAICARLLELEEINRAFCIYCYASMRHEAGTWKFMDLLLKQGKCVAVPKVSGKKLDFYVITGKSDLEEGTMGIMEPKASCLKINDTEAPMIVPGIAFDKSRNRLGYGGGYYDRFFEKEPDHRRIAIAYDFQIFDRIPTDPHDKTVDMIIIP